MPQGIQSASCDDSNTAPSFQTRPSFTIRDIGAAEPFDTHAAEMPAGLDEHDPLPHGRHLHGGDDARAARRARPGRLNQECR
jgi:hypothetical protein